MKTSQPRWFFPSNSANTRLILAQGLLAGHDGFLEKYYRDLLELCPGWIPLFKNTVDEASLRWVTSEAEHLQTCLIEIDPGRLEVQGTIPVYKQEQWIQTPFDEAITDTTVSRVMLPAPLPLTMIKKIIFASKEQLQVFQKDCATRGNIVLDNKLLSATQKDTALLQTGEKGILEDVPADAQHTSAVPAGFDISGDNRQEGTAGFGQDAYRETYAWGGMLALLFYMAKNGRLSHDFYQYLCQEGSDNPPPAGCEEITALLVSLSKPGDRTNEDEHPLSEREHINHEIGKIVTRSQAVKDDLLAFFRDYPWQDEKVQGRALQLYQTLYQFDTGGNLQKKPSDYFNKETFLGRNLLMLFYRDSSEDWLSTEHSSPGQFNELELLGFAVLFGLRDKFTGVAPFLRRYPQLQNHISVLMARYAHHSIDSPLSFADPVKIPETVWGLLQKKTHRKRLVTQLKLQTCVSTIFPARQYAYDAGKIVIPGIIEPDYRIDDAGYFQEMQHVAIDDVTYKKLSR